MASFCKVLSSALKLICWYLLIGVCCARPDFKCKCVPDQWEGVMWSEEREFDLAAGQSISHQNSIFVHYDFVNKKFALVDIMTGRKTIADYNVGNKYIITADGCRGIKTAETMRKMCLPEHKRFLGAFMLDTSVPVGLFQFHGSMNVSVKTTVSWNTCIPVYEEVYLYQTGYQSITNSWYLDVSTGINNSKVFDIPESCGFEDEHEYSDSIKKRTEIDEDFLKALKNRLYIFV